MENPPQQSPEPLAGAGLFIQTAKKRFYKIKKARAPDKARHVDFSMSGLDAKKRVQVVTLDIKYRQVRGSD